ncbi:N-acetylmuramoyl-L-alanine amidase [Flavobacterium sp. I-SCBP12n]|uniref:N-acetylmuramoyl-L-alanine amidase n=1 Tax=Flavobacterium pygoscelis TaxID=2893176 RepID=A0A9X2BK90_9FLAO|nr:N-acetylmuramoyl-L-alanine amidase [Flavobacterium pygoscelis]MCK8140947.1 N-acetylmuramoyl-L-alanine amidase [Flavobacterium pygoscelis]
MKLIRKIKFLYIILFLLFSLSIFSQSNTKFVVILDAGHGGKDPGNSYNGFIEKEIALKTALKLEKYLKKEKDIDVIHTRKTDVFIELVDRPRKANTLHANLFVSIHCNSVKNPIPYGTETFVMGLARSQGNLEIAKQENSVILFEKNYKQTYKGFDPKKPETLIGLKMLQEDFLDRSIQLASKIENNFINQLNRKSRGIKQTPLWVLDAAYMPSVLIELGFLSNKKEGIYLNSAAGQENMAKAIATAIISYKKEYFGSGYNKNMEQSKYKKGNVTSTKEKAKNSVLEETNNKKKLKVEDDGILFKVQFATGKQNLKLVPSNFKGLKNVSVRSTNASFYKYSYGATSDYSEAKKNLKEVQSKGYSSAYIIVFKDGKNISLEEALK